MSEYKSTAEAAEWLALDDATHWGEHEKRLFAVVEECEALQARIEATEAKLARAMEALAPFVSGCFYDNGDLTVAPPAKAIYLNEYEIAFWAHRGARAALAEIKEGEG